MALETGAVSGLTPRLPHPEVAKLVICFGTRKDAELWKSNAPELKNYYPFEFPLISTVLYLAREELLRLRSFGGREGSGG